MHIYIYIYIYIVNDCSQKLVGDREWSTFTVGGGMLLVNVNKDSRHDLWYNKGLAGVQYIQWHLDSSLVTSVISVISQG